jgi:dethiobiotin synthetase
MTHWFITGTDTEVGKSVVTACLAEAAQLRGSVIAAKPIASGVPHGEVGEDAALLASAGKHPPQLFAAFREPLSPHRAAALEGRQLDKAALLRWIRQLEADTVLVEGVGGWMVPLTSTQPPYLVSDLAQDLGAPVILVAANRLGVLNHTLLTATAIQNRGLKLSGVILNSLHPANEPSQKTNLTDLRALLQVPVVHAPKITVADEQARAQLGQHLWQSLDLSC